MNWFISLIELLIDKTPIIGKIKSVVERDIPMCQISNEELIPTNDSTRYVAF